MSLSYILGKRAQLQNKLHWSEADIPETVVFPVRDQDLQKR